MENLEIYEIEEQEEQSDFKVVDLASADWCIRKIKKNNAIANEKIAYANLEIDKLKKYISDVEKERDSSNNYLEYSLWEYLQIRRLKDPKFKIQTVTGTVSTRKNTNWTYDDEKVIGFLKENNFNDLIRVKEEINKTALKKAFKVSGTHVVDEDGQIIEGIEVQEIHKINITIK